MPVFKVQLVGGNFQDSTGAVLVNGYLTMKLSSDEEVNDSLICSGIEIRIQLDANGSVVTNPAQSVWGNDVMLPVNSFYKVTGFTAAGQIAWGPNNQQVAGIGSFDTGTWIPNSVISWTPSPQPLSLEIAGTAFSSQIVLDFVNTGNVTFTDAGSGKISASATLPPSLALEVAGTPLSSQTVLDFVNTGNVIFTDAGSGQVSASVTIPSPPASLPQPDVSRFSLWQAALAGFSTGGSFLTVVNDVQQAGGSTGVDTDIPADATTGQAHAVTVVTNGSRFYNGMPFVYPSRKTIVKGSIKFNANNNFAAAKFYIGVGNATGSANPLTLDFVGIGVEKVSSVAQGNWILFTSVGGSTTRTDSGIPIVYSQRYNFSIVLASGVCSLFINGTLATSTTLNLPVADLGIIWWLEDFNGGGGSAEAGWFEYIYAENATP